MSWLTAFQVRGVLTILLNDPVAVVICALFSPALESKESYDLLTGRCLRFVHTGLTLELTPGRLYPTGAPPISMSLTGKGAGSAALACWRCWQLLQLAKDMVGRPMVYELVSWLQTNMASIDATHLAAALAQVAPTPPAAMRGKGAGVGGEGDKVQRALHDLKI